MSNDKKEVRRNESKLSYHKQFKKRIKAPTITNKFDTFVLGWRTLTRNAVGGFSNWKYRKENRSQFFRYIADFVSKNQDCYDVTLTGISKFAEDKRKEFIRIATSWSDEIKTTLRLLIFFLTYRNSAIGKTF